MHHVALLEVAATTAGCEERRVRGREGGKKKNFSESLLRRARRGEAKWADRPSRQQSDGEESKQEERGRGGETQMEGKKAIGNSGGLVMLLRGGVVVCSVKPQCPRQRRCQHPSAASFPRMEGEGEDQDAESSAMKARRREAATGDGVQDKASGKRGARKASTMTCGRSIVRPASVSRSETWGESGVRKFESSLCALLAV